MGQRAQWLSHSYFHAGHSPDTPHTADASGCEASESWAHSHADGLSQCTAGCHPTCLDTPAMSDITSTAMHGSVYVALHSLPAISKVQNTHYA